MQRPELGINERPLFRTAVIGLVMFESEMSHVITQTKQKMVVAIMSRAEQRRRLLYQIAVLIPHLLRHIQRHGAVSSDIHFDWRVLPLIERNDFEIFATDDRRI